MHTSVGFLAFASFLSAVSWDAALPEIPWQTSYHEARILGQKAKKPLAVIVGAGKSGYQQLIQEGSLSSDIRKILANEFIPVYLDTELAENKRLIADLGINFGKGIVLSDREGKTQAFFHEGTISEKDVTRQLRHFADPSRVVYTTTTLSSSRVSYYPSLSTDIHSSTPYSPATSTRNC